jgi:formylglycine-generating enzyme required for sulfatase activity
VDRKGNPSEVGGSSQDVTAEGVRDLGGNVAEWVADAFVQPYPSCEGACKDPIVEVGTLRVLRGGMWHSEVLALRGAARDKIAAGSMTPDIGFRCAIPVKTKTGP